MDKIKSISDMVACCVCFEEDCKHIEVVGEDGFGQDYGCNCCEDCPYGVTFEGVEK